MSSIKPRRFEKGFSSSFFNLQYFCLIHGYDFVYVKRAYQLRKRGEARSKPMPWQQALAEIDRVIRIPLGLEPIVRSAE